MVLNDAGLAVFETWQWLGTQYDYVELDRWIIMPNHVHGIIVIMGGCRGGSRTAQGDSQTVRGGSRTAPTGKRKPIGRLVGAFKTVSTKRINQMDGTPGAKLWQRNYYEHIIRNDTELHRIREYITNNPARWESDRENPASAGTRTKPE